MARTATPLTDKTIKSSKPKEKDYKLFDGNGLFLLITKNGGTRWRLKYQFNGKEKIFALGTYPQLTLAKARKMREELREDIANGIDPAEEKKQKKMQQKEIQLKDDKTFKVVALESLDKKNRLSENYKKKLEQSFEKNAYPFIGNNPISEITKKEILEIVERVENRGAIEMAHRLLTQINRVFNFAYAKEYIHENPCSRIDKQEELKTHKRGKFPTFTDKRRIKELLNAIDTFTGEYSTKMALTLAPYVALRPANIRLAQWSEINFTTKEWTIPKEKMKIKDVDFIVPLSDRVIEIFKEARKYDTGSKYVFPSYRNINNAMSDNTMNLALKRMGFAKEEIVPHGFRAMFSTIANEHISEHGVHPKVIDVQLAHSAKSKVESSYNRADYMSDRIKLMQWWSDYLDEVAK